MNVLLLLAAALLLSPDVRTTDPTLAVFSLQETGTPPEASPPDRSRAWEWTGLFNYGAAGAQAGCQLYRNDRSGAWDPTPENAQLRIGLLAAGVEGANRLSDMLYDRDRKLAWITRLAELAVFTYGASINCQRGWERR